MRTNWRVTCLGLLALGPLLTACGGDDDGTTEAAATSSAADGTGVYGETQDPDAPEPTDVATDAPRPTPTATPSSSAPGPAPKAEADVVITYSGWIGDTSAVEVGAYVAGVAQTDGSCTLTLTSGGGSATAVVRGEPDAASTSCPTMSVPRAQLSPGAWTAVVRYESPSTAGQSDPVEVVVP